MLLPEVGELEANLVLPVFLFSFLLFCSSRAERKENCRWQFLVKEPAGAAVIEYKSVSQIEFLFLLFIFFLIKKRSKKIKTVQGNCFAPLALEIPCLMPCIAIPFLRSLFLRTVGQVQSII